MDREEARHAPIGEPAIPPAVGRVLDDVGLDLVVLERLVAPRERLEPFLLRPHPRQEGDAARVGKPLDAEDAGRDVGETARFAAIGRDEVDLRLVVALVGTGGGALGDEGAPPPRGAPARPGGFLSRGVEVGWAPAPARPPPPTPNPPSLSTPPA